MTIKIPPENIFDKILKIFGKERKIIIPSEADKIYRKLGQHVQILAKRENFFKALLKK
jgi:hypothetical protein